MLLNWIKHALISQGNVSPELVDKLMKCFEAEMSKSYAFYTKNDEFCLVNLDHINCLLLDRARRSTMISSKDDDYLAKGVLAELASNERFLQISSTIFVNPANITGYNSKLGIVYFGNREQLINVSSVPILAKKCGKRLDVYNQTEYAPTKPKAYL